MKITQEWIDNQEERSCGAASVTLPIEYMEELLFLARRGLGPRVVTVASTPDADSAGVHASETPQTLGNG